MKRSKIQAWWADQNKLNPYELTAPYNKCKNTINSLAKIECSIAVIVAFCIVFFYSAESNWDNFISIIQRWLPCSIVLSMLYLMRTDQTSEQAIEIFKKSFDSRLRLWALINLLIVVGAAEFVGAISGELPAVVALLTVAAGSVAAAGAAVSEAAAVAVGAVG